MPIEAAHKSWWQTSEVVFGLPFFVSIALQLAVPIPLPSQLHILFIVIGAALAILGLVFIVLARQEMARYGQRTDPGHPTSQIVTTGVFSISRNPLYLGAGLLLLGIAVITRLTWFFILILPTLIACHYILIAPEERYLLAKFGEEYARYTARVYRWIGRTRIVNDVRNPSKP